MKRYSRTRLFLLEMIVNLFVFIIGAAICFITLSKAYQLSAESRLLANSQICLENAANAFKACNGDIYLLKDILNGRLTEDNTVSVWYDKNWNIVYENDGIYELTITFENVNEQNMQNAQIIITKPVNDKIAALNVSEYLGG